MIQLEEDGYYYSVRPNGVMPDAEGNYRWIYEFNSSENSSYLKLYLLIMGLIILIPGAILFFMIFGNKGYLDGAGTYLGIWLAIFLAVELLTYLIYKGIEKAKGGKTDIPYAMGEDSIIVHPGNKIAPVSYLRTDFSLVKDVQLEVNNDLILLLEIARVSHVYVYREDLPFVLGFILDRVPQTDKILARKAEYGKYLK